MKFRTAGERCLLIIGMKTTGTVISCSGHRFNKVDSVVWSSRPKEEDVRQSSGDINSQVLAAKRKWKHGSISLESITVLFLFSLERNSTRDPETLQPRPLHATLDMGSVDLDRPRPWHLTLGPGCALSSGLTSYDLSQHPLQQKTELGIRGFGWYK